jgi:hypothetical protein
LIIDRIKPDFNELSLEITKRFWYPFDVLVHWVKRPARLLLVHMQEMFGGEDITTEKEAA